MASAKRLIELRHPCLNSSRIAEISVPAWPDTDPPHKVDNREAPGYRLRDGPDADAHQKQPRHRHQQHGCQRAADAEEGKPTQRRMRREHDVRDLLGDRPEGLARPYDPEFSRCWIDPGVFGFSVRWLPSSLQPFAGACSTGASSSSEFGLMTAAT